MDFYHEGQRALQDRFDSRRIADRLEQVTLHDRLTESDQAFIARMPMFFLASMEPDGRPDVSYKGGAPGFVRVPHDAELAFPHYDGNGMFRSLGNIARTSAVALLFVDFEHPSRLRVHGEAQLSEDPELLASWPGAQAAVRVAVQRVFPNCPRYIHRMPFAQESPYVPGPDGDAPEPDWKRMAVFRDALPEP